MDMILLLLAVSKSPMLASEIAPMLSRDPNAVRATLTLLRKEGLARSIQVGTKGPKGTHRWEATEAGKACVDELLLWIRGQR